MSRPKSIKSLHQASWNKLKCFFQNYWMIFIATVVMVADLLLEFFGVISDTKIWGGLFFIIVGISQFTKSQTELDKLKTPHPIIVIKKTDLVIARTRKFQLPNLDANNEMRQFTAGTSVAWEYTRVIRDAYGSMTGVNIQYLEQTFALVHFINNPSDRREIHTAVNVIARIEFTNSSGDRLIRPIKGRWSQLPEPTQTIGLNLPLEESYVDIPSNGDERILLIALKHKEDEECYAVDDQSYLLGDFLQLKELSLGTGEIIVNITLSGDNLNDVVFKLRLVNPGKGRDIDLLVYK